MDNLSDPAPGTAPTADAVLERVFAGTSGADLRAALVGAASSHRGRRRCTSPKEPGSGSATPIG